MTTAPNQALLFRLLGDRNPLHSDPGFAAGAGFSAPILHGLCTLGVAVRALVAKRYEYRREPISHLEARFSAPVYPGETIMTEIWSTEEGAAFRATAKERDVVVLDMGRAVSARPTSLLP